MKRHTLLNLLLNSRYSVKDRVFESSTSSRIIKGYDFFTPYSIFTQNLLITMMFPMRVITSSRVSWRPLIKIFFSKADFSSSGRPRILYTSALSDTWRVALYSTNKRKVWKVIQMVDEKKKRMFLTKEKWLPLSLDWARSVRMEKDFLKSPHSQPLIHYNSDSVNCKLQWFGEVLET